MKYLKRHSEAILLAFGCVLLAWFLLASLVFSVRHPWATEMEHMAHIRSVLGFQYVPYKEMRGIE